jgi:predicted O-linked N-acetylglucosamine transferase (SPINDLY family)
LPEQAFVFCAFHNPWKIGAGQFDVWMRLLLATPNGVLWLKDDGVVRGTLCQAAAARGVDPSRLIFAGRVADRRAHLARYKLADLFLDASPYNAHATANEVLSAGLPILTCAGNTFAGRVAASMLSAAGVPELVTPSLTDYESLALALVADQSRLAEIRRRLNSEQVPLFDTAGFCMKLESAYERMHAMAFRGERPRSFTI